MVSWITLVWNSTDSLEFHGGTPRIQGGRRSLQTFPQDDAMPKTADPNRRVRIYVVTGTFHATTWTRFNEQAFEYSLNTTYPYVVVYDHWNATTTSIETTQRKVILQSFSAVPQQNGQWYDYNFQFEERD